MSVIFCENGSIKISKFFEKKPEKICKHLKSSEDQWVVELEEIISSIGRSPPAVHPQLLSITVFLRISLNFEDWILIFERKIAGTIGKEMQIVLPKAKEFAGQGNQSLSKEV